MGLALPGSSQSDIDELLVDRLLAYDILMYERVAIWRKQFQKLLGAWPLFY